VKLALTKYPGDFEAPLSHLEGLLDPLTAEETKRTLLAPIKTRKHQKASSATFLSSLFARYSPKSPKNDNNNPKKHKERSKTLKVETEKPRQARKSEHLQREVGWTPVYQPEVVRGEH